LTHNMIKMQLEEGSILSLVIIYKNVCLL